MFCSTLGATTPVSGPPNGGGGPAADASVGDIAPTLALPSDATPPLPAPSPGESNIVSLGEVPGIPPDVAPEELAEDGLLVLAACVVVEVGAAAVEEAEELDGDEMM